MELHVPSLASTPLFYVAGWPVTNALLGTWLAMLLLLTFLAVAVRRPKLVPAGAQNFLEVAVSANVSGHRRRAGG